MRLLVAIALLITSAGTAWSAPRPKPKRSNGRILVNFRPGLSRAERLQVAVDSGLTPIDDLEPADIAIFDAPGGRNHPSAVKLSGNPMVLDLEDDVITNWLLSDEPVSLAATPLPSLAHALGSLESLARRRAARKTDEKEPPKEQKEQIPWGVERVNAPKAWNESDGSTMGEGIRVAVIDTGVNCSHPDLDCVSGDGYNAVEPGAQPRDEHGHGTHVAGTIAARLNGQGVAGVAPKVKIIPIKVLDKNGDGSVSSIVKAITWATRNGVQVINMSLGNSEGSKTLHKAIQRAVAKGIVIVAAAGNEGPENDTVAYPAAYPEVIAVAASDRKDRAADFSSRGAEVDFIAPGLDILSTLPDNSYGKFSGTSMASPHVAGLAAIALANGAAGTEGVRAALKRAASPLCPTVEEPSKAKKPSKVRVKAGASKCLGEKEEGAGMIDATKLLQKKVARR